MKNSKELSIFVQWNCQNWINQCCLQVCFDWKIFRLSTHKSNVWDNHSYRKSHQIFSCVFLEHVLARSKAQKKHLHRFDFDHHSQIEEMNEMMWIFHAQQIEFGDKKSNIGKTTKWERKKEEKCKTLVHEKKRKKWSTHVGSVWQCQCNKRTWECPSFHFMFFNEVTEMHLVLWYFI